MKTSPLLVVILLFMSFSACAGDVACVCASDGRSFDDVPFKVKLSSEWTDQQILAALKLASRHARVRKAPGVDGESVTYDFKRQIVTITRAVGAVNILFTRDGHDTVVWQLCVPLAVYSPNHSFNPDALARAG